MKNYLGILDWGIGGLGLYQQIKQNSQLPVMYFSDSGHQPYGQTPKKQLHDRLEQICQKMFASGASKVAIACNAASAAFADTNDINGIITHGVSLLNQADKGFKKIGLLAGRGTVYSRIFPNCVQSHKYQLQQRVSQPLSAHVEAGRLSGSALHTDLKKIMAPLHDADAVLLACTHYPAISDQIAQYVSPHCKLLDPANTMANWIMQNWHFDESADQDLWFTSGDPSQLKNNGKRAFGVEIPNVRKLTI